MAITWNSTDKWIEIDSAKYSGTATGGSSTTINTGLSLTADALVGYIVENTTTGERRMVKSNTTGGVLTVFPDWDTTPISGNGFAVFYGVPDLFALPPASAIDGLSRNEVLIQGGGIKVESGGRFGWGHRPLIIFDHPGTGGGLTNDPTYARMLRTDAGGKVQLGYERNGRGVNGGEMRVIMDSSQGVADGSGRVLARAYQYGELEAFETRFTAAAQDYIGSSNSDPTFRNVQLWAYGTGTLNLVDCSFSACLPNTKESSVGSTFIRPRNSALPEFKGFGVDPSKDTLEDPEFYFGPTSFATNIATQQGRKAANYTFIGEGNAGNRLDRNIVLYQFSTSGSTLWNIGYRPVAVGLNMASDFYTAPLDLITYDVGQVATLDGYYYPGIRADFTITDTASVALTDAVIGIWDKNGDEAINTAFSGTNPATPTKVFGVGVDANGQATIDVLYGRAQQSAVGSKRAAWSSGNPLYPFTVRVRADGYLEQEGTRDALTAGTWGMREKAGNLVEAYGLLADPNRVDTGAAALALASKFSLDWANRIITVTGAATPQEMYDYTQYAAAQSSAIQYDQLMTAIQVGKFDMGDTRIVIASGGTLTVDTDEAVGALVFGDRTVGTNAIRVQSGGELVVGQAGSLGRSIDFTMALTIDDQTHSSTYSNILVDSGGTFTWVSTEIQSHINLRTDESSTFTTAGQDCVLLNNGGQTAPNGKEPAITAYTTGADVDGVLLNGFRMDFTVQPSNPVEDVKFRDLVTAATGLSSSSPSNSFFEFSGVELADAGAVPPILHWAEKWSRFTNMDVGSNFSPIVGNSADSANNKGLHEIRQEVTFPLTSGSGAKVYTRDTDNGNRLAANQIGTNQDYAADRAYTATESGGTASITTDGGILSAVYWRDTGGLKASDNEFDSRGNANDTTDVFTFLKVEYGQGVATSDVTLKGTSAVEVSLQSLPDFGITQATKATVAAYTGLAFASGALTLTSAHSAQEVYDWQKYHESENPADVWDNGKASFITSNDGENLTPASGYAINLAAQLTGTAAYLGGTFEIGTGGSFADTITLNGSTLDFQNAGTYDYRSKSFLGTIELVNSSGGAVTVQLDPSTAFTNTGPNITVEASIAITIANANLIDGTRVQLYNVTQDAELDNSVVSGGAGYSYLGTLGPGQEIEDGDAIRLRATHHSGTTYKEPLQEQAAAIESGVTFLAAQEDWVAANGLGLDGSLQTDFVADYGNLEVDINAPGSTFSVAGLIAWLLVDQTTADGIRNFYGALMARDQANWTIDTGAVDLKLDNVNAATITQGDAVVLVRDDLIYPQVVPTSGGGGIGMIQSGLVFVTETGVSGLTPAESAQLLALPSAGEIDTQLSGTHGAGSWVDTGTDVNVTSVGGTVVGSPDALKADVSNLDVAVSTRLADADYTAPDNAGIASEVWSHDLSGAQTAQSAGAILKFIQNIPAMIFGR